MGRYQREKGKRVEREAVRACQDWLGSPEACRRSRQADGSTDADLHDAIPGVHVEVKGRAKIAAIRFWEKTFKECRGDDVPVVLLREDGTTEFFVLFRMRDYSQFAEGVVQNFRINILRDPRSQE